VSRGYFCTAAAARLTISLSRPLRRGLLHPNGSPAKQAAANGSTVQPAFDGGAVWRLDRDDVSSTFVRLRGNLFALFRWVRTRRQRCN
jgi:hypothetical protein